MAGLAAARPTLLAGCAHAATAREARYRIDAPRPPARATRVVALDPGAAEIVAGLATRSWPGAHFLRYGGPAGDELAADLVLARAGGGTARLSEELAGADVMVLVATADGGAAAASAIGDACTLRGIMTAGLVVGRGGAAGAAVSALRPHARVLLVSDDRQDLAELLSAIGA